METMYYIQNEGFVGDSLIWWGINGVGYTTDIDKAGKYTKEEAQSICRNRKEDVAWPVNHIDSIIRKHVTQKGLNYKRSRTWRGGK